MSAYPPPPGFDRTITIASAMNLVWAARAHWLAVGDRRADLIEGPVLTDVARRLGAKVKPESVRKTAFAWSMVIHLVVISEGGDWHLLRDVCLIVFGTVFACRPGETSFDVVDVIDNRTSFTVIFRSEKPRGGRAAAARLSEPRSRTCALPILRTVWTRWTPHRPRSGALWPREPFDPRPLSTPEIRTMLMRRFGRPPINAALRRSLPWSMRATCATLLWESGMSPERIRYWGRWASEVAVMYVVLGPRGQADLLCRVPAFGGDAFDVAGADQPDLA